MNNYGELFISAVLDRDDIHAFDRHGITREVLATDTERAAYDFIRNYAEQNGGRIPDYRTVEAEVPEFVYIPQSQDTFRFMADQIKEYAGKLAVSEYWNSDEVAGMFNTMSTDAFTEHVVRKMEDIRRQTVTSENIGIDIVRDGERITAEYFDRKSGKSLRVWKSLFPTMNREIGGYYSSNMYAWFGRSGRGKSIITMMECIYAALQGATVMIWSLEMGWYELATRIIAAVSALREIFGVDVNGHRMGAGFDTRGIISGNLGEQEAAFIDFMKRLNSEIDGRIIMRSIDEEAFVNRSASGLVADIRTLEADVVLVDPIYYMQMERNESRVSGGDVAATSKKLRAICGREKVVMHVITQADEVTDELNENEEREIRLPRRNELSKAKQILQDSSNTIAIDTCDGRGMIGLGKGRSGGEGVTIELVYLPQYGLVQEVDAVAAADIFAPIGDTSGGGSEVF